jgi:hypothetical protein
MCENIRLRLFVRSESLTLSTSISTPILEDRALDWQNEEKNNKNNELNYIEFLKFLAKNEGWVLHPYQEEAARLMFRVWEKTHIRS